MVLQWLPYILAYRSKKFGHFIFGKKKISIRLIRDNKIWRLCFIWVLKVWGIILGDKNYFKFWSFFRKNFFNSTYTVNIIINKKIYYFQLQKHEVEYPEKNKAHLIYYIKAVLTHRQGRHLPRAPDFFGPPNSIMWDNFKGPSKGKKRKNGLDKNSYNSKENKC